MNLDSRSQKNLVGVHPHLVKVVQEAAADTTLDFCVTEGLRSLARQQQLVDAGASTTMKSRHLTGHAVDLAPMLDGRVHWDWPLFYRLAPIIKAAAFKLKVPLEWGGDWKKFKDGPHFQLPWRDYP